MPGFIFVPIVRVRNVGFLAIVRNVVCTNCRGANPPPSVSFLCIRKLTKYFEKKSEK